MGQTPEGSIRAIQTILARYGDDYYKKIGAKGGSVKTGDGFAHGKVDPSTAGKLSGKNRWVTTKRNLTKGEQE